MGLFTKATKVQAKLRMAISGPSGSGKTYTALQFATELARLGNGKIAVVDTESGSASKYADIFDFDVAELTTFHPNNYVKMIREAEAAGYDVVILDSITHAWTGKGGILDIVGGNFSKWKEVNPIEQNFIQSIIGSKVHVIATMRAKTQYEVEKDERGKATPRKVGMGAIQRDGIEYEFDIVGMMDLENTLTIEKTRCSAIRGERVSAPDAKFLRPIIKWLGAGAEDEGVPEPPKPQRNGDKAALQRSVDAVEKKHHNTNEVAANDNGNDREPLPFEPTHTAAVDWGMQQGVFTHIENARNSYKKLNRELGHPEKGATAEQVESLMRAWVEKVKAKVAEAEQPPTDEALAPQEEVAF